MTADNSNEKKCPNVKVEDLNSGIISELRREITQYITSGILVRPISGSNGLTFEVEMPSEIRIPSELSIAVRLTETTDEPENTQCCENALKHDEKIVPSSSIPSHINVKMSVSGQNSTASPQIVQIKTPNSIHVNLKTDVSPSSPLRVFQTYLECMGISESDLKVRVESIKSPGNPEPGQFTTKDYGYLVRRCRKSWLLTQAVLAKAIGTSKQTLNEIEKGKKAKISWNLFQKIVDVLECSPDYLLGQVNLLKYNYILEAQTGKAHMIPFLPNSSNPENVLQRSRNLLYLLMSQEVRNSKLSCMLFSLLQTNDKKLYSQAAKFLYLLLSDSSNMQSPSDLIPCSGKSCINCLFPVGSSAN